jgi:hypothetical protein
MRALACVIVLVSVAHADVPSVSERDAIATLSAVIAKPDAKAAAGAATKIAWIDKIADAEATDKAWRFALATAKLTIIWEEVDAGSINYVVEAPNKARATITANIWSTGDIWVIAKPILGKKMRGACVAVPQVVHPFYIVSNGVNNDGERYSKRGDDEMRTRTEVDVDGDAIPDSFVPAPPSKNACRHDTPYRVYVMRGTCGHEAGVVGPGWSERDVLATPPDASGLRPLTMTAEHTETSSSRIPESVRTTRSFVATNGRYALKSKNTTRGVCHHCAVLTCSAR